MHEGSASTTSQTKRSGFSQRFPPHAEAHGLQQLLPVPSVVWALRAQVAKKRAAQPHKVQNGAERVWAATKGRLRTRGCDSLILRLFAFVFVCSRWRTFTCVFGPFSQSLKSAFVCVCAPSFALANTPFYCTPFTEICRLSLVLDSVGLFGFWAWRA